MQETWKAGRPFVTSASFSGGTSWGLVAIAGNISKILAGKP
jgi:hypothetical protein